MLRRNSRIRFANRAAAAIFGFDRHRVKGAHIIEAVPSIELERRIDSVLAGEAAGEPIIVSGKRTDRTYAVSVYPLTAGTDEETEGTVTGALVVAEDQSERLALDRARQEFLSNVSHELRTPLSSLKLTLETLVRSGDDEARAMFLPQALRELDRLTALVGRLLEQARAESGRLVLQIEKLDLEAAARPIVESFEAKAASKDISLQLRAVRTLSVDADPHRLSQVFVNLLDNAIRFTPEHGSVRVELDSQDGQAVIRVSDTGLGIPYKDLPHIFERFYVADRSRARGITGAGLGLSIVKEIVEAHHGSVEADSMLGSGTEITVRLPLNLS